MTAAGGETNPPAFGPADDARPAGLAKRKKPRKEEIVAEATRLFAERGYEGTSMGDLAERVGLRKASLFHHFESKDVLYTTVLSQLLAGVEVAFLDAAAAEGSFIDRLDALTDAITAMLGSSPHAARLLIREAMDWGPVMRDRLAGSIQEVLKASADFTRAGQREGAFDPELDPEQVIITLVGIYFMPFVIDRTVERFLGRSPFDDSFVEDRRKDARRQIRLLMLARQ